MQQLFLENMLMLRASMNTSPCVSVHASHPDVLAEPHKQKYKINPNTFYA